MLGSKIENLKILKDKNFNVPDFKILSFNDVIDDKFYEDIKNCSNVSEDLKNILKKHFKEIELDLKKGNYAIRSSCNLEDSANYSFAGQFTTYLNIKEKDVPKYIKECFLSLYNDNVLEYLKLNNINPLDLKMNVLIQDMVPSKLSGILFTSNVRGLLNESVIVVGEGLGENIVSDKVDTTSYYFNTTDNIYYYEGKKDLLSKKEIEELISISSEIKNYLGDYLDIEFAITDKIYILQARKITTINPENPLIMDNSNIVESYPGISLPLTCSFVNIIYTGVFKGAISRILKNEKQIEKLNPVFNNMVGSSNGRLYYKISNWYQIIKCLPFSNKIIPIWQEMLGVKNKTVSEDSIKQNIFEKTKTCFNFIIELINTPKNMDELNTKFITINDNFYKEYDNGLTKNKVDKLYNNIKNELFSCWDITLFNDMYTFIFTSLFKSRIEKKYPNDKDLPNKYISGISNIESIKPIKELINISYNYHNMTEEEKNNKIKEYIKLYGDRNLEELKLESETFRSNENLLLEKIKYYNEDQDKLKTMYQNINNKEELSLPKLDFLSKFYLNKCRSGIKNREISRLNRSRIFGMVREMILYLGTKYEEENIISKKRDIFYLTIEEVFDLIDNPKDMKDIINTRKKSYEIYNLLPPYSRLIFMEKEFDKVHTSINQNKITSNTNTLNGTPCSNGYVEGEALVIENATVNYDVKDKILITKMTDPGWVFLLTTAKGVISEKGSLLSHTAIISRELKVPSITGVDNLLTTIHTGDYISMNGTTGEIKIIKRCQK